MRGLIALLMLVGCGNGDVRKYDNGLFEIAAGFSAKEVCSCMFVAGHDEDTCREWTRASPEVATFKVDLEAREIRAKALGGAKTVARFEGERFGCRIVAE